MTYNEAKIELKEYLQRKKQIEIKKKKADELRRLIENCKSPKIDTIGLNGSESLSVQIAKLVDFENEIEKEIIEAEAICKKILNKISIIRDNNKNLANILELKYLSGLKICEICSNLNYCKRSVFGYLKAGIYYYSKI